MRVVIDCNFKFSLAASPTTQKLREVCLIKPLLHPKYTMEIGSWNVRTLYRSANIAQAAREMKRRGIDVMGISDTLWTGQGKMQLTEGETFIYSGRDDDNHREGVCILMSKHATRSLDLMDWTLISERVIQARFYSTYIKLMILPYICTH